MRSLIAYLSICLILAYIALITQTTTGCQKPSDNRIDSVSPPPPPPPPPVPDTISYVKRIEETFLQSNPSIARRTRDYNFYYDNLKRVTTVGIKNYGPLLTDTLTTRFFYNGANNYPYMIIMPNVRNSVAGGPSYYDTAWITYGTNNRPIKDSSTDWLYNNTNNTLEHHLPLLRLYSYPDSQTVKIEWYATVGWSNQVDLIRRDSLSTGADRILQNEKAAFYSAHNFISAYTTTEAIMPGNIVNPLSRLNISGMPFSQIYSPVKEEMFGNIFHWAVYNSNPLAYYLDFCSRWIPNTFFLASYNHQGDVLNSGWILFTTEVTPWAQRPSYPSEIKVSCTYSYPGDKFQYKYYY